MIVFHFPWRVDVYMETDSSVAFLDGCLQWFLLRTSDLIFHTNIQYIEFDGR